jgi:hypothetical protein
MKDLKGNPPHRARFLAFAVCASLMSSSATTQQVEIDLDRDTPGIQRSIDGLFDPLVQGAVMVTGSETDTVGRYAVGIRTVGNLGDNVLDCAHTFGNAGDVEDGFLDMPFHCDARSIPNYFRRANLFPLSNVELGPDGHASLFHFDVTFDPEQSEVITLSFIPSTETPSYGVNINGQPFMFGVGSDNPIPTVGATISIIIVEPPDCADSGYYILDTFGGRHRVGSPPTVTGPIYYGREVARDMEGAQVTSGGTKSKKKGLPVDDLAVLDRFGSVQFVSNPTATPAQVFYFPEDATPSCGFAVDVEIANDNQGFWVLTEGGGIYAAGSALRPGENGSQPIDDQLCAVLNVPLTGALRDPSLPDPDPTASLRAVGFIVVQGANPEAPSGFVVLDSMGGHHILDGRGGPIDDDISDSVLNAMGGTSETVYPFFRGLDIARDIELYPNTFQTFSAHGLVIFDGWGGVHPVPVGPNRVSPVDFLRNEGPIYRTAVGLPYLKIGFDDPTTPEQELDFGIDSNSIFRDIEFCRSPIFGGDGVYTLDAFGGVFAFGGTRVSFGADSVAPKFTGGPYFFPALYAQDLEAD